MKSSFQSSGRLRPLDQQLIVGRLKEHGVANYQFRKHEAESYFVKLATPKGERLLWGKDLHRAIKTADTQPELGDMVGARRIGREPVKVMAQQWDRNDRAVGQNEQLAHRNRWVVEKVQFFAVRAKLARRVRDDQVDIKREIKAHPELKSTYLTLRGAEEVANRRIADAKDRERFVALVREAVAESVKKGEPLPALRLRQAKWADKVGAPSTMSRDRTGDPAR